MTDQTKRRPGEVRLGRPPIPEDERCLVVSVRLDHTAREALAYVQEQWEMGKSASARRALIEAAERLRRARRKDTK